jgi:poly-beta-1,6-N-acetyl-D-glucosamine synthase
MTLAVIACFLDEEEHLGRFLRSMAAQSRPPERLVLVDDGSRDRSSEIAARFADEHPYAVAVRRPRRPLERDRLAAAPELRAFQWAVAEQIGEERFDVVAKLDADLDLAPRLLETVERAFLDDPRLGLTGAFLWSPGPDGAVRRDPKPEYHVRGATKFYRAACLREISPLPAILGWDTIDEVHARKLGWRTRSLDAPGAPTLHLRPTGAHDGLVRGFRRWGECAWAYGAHPLHVLAVGTVCMRRRPYVLGGLNYLAGWALAGARRRPRARPDVRAHCRAEQVRRARSLAGRVRPA